MTSPNTSERSLLMAVTLLLLLVVCGLGCPKRGREPEPRTPLACSLPGLSELATAGFAVVGERSGAEPYAACVDVFNVMRLEHRDRSLRRWVLQACARCGCDTTQTSGPDGGAHE